MTFRQHDQGSHQHNVSQGPDGLLHLAEVAASLDAPAAAAGAAPGRGRVLAQHINASVSAFSQALATQLMAANAPAREAPAAALPQHWQQAHQQLDAAPQPPPLQEHADGSLSSHIAALLLQQLLLLQGTAQPQPAPLAGQPAGLQQQQQQQHLQRARQPAEDVAAVQAAAAANHSSNAVLQAALSRAGFAQAAGLGTGFTDEGSGALPAARLPRSSRSSPVQHPRGIEEDDSDYSPAGPHSSSGGSGKPQQWTDAEQARLEALVAQYGTRNWSSIASRMTGRTGKQCRERYINNTPELKKVREACSSSLLLVFTPRTSCTALAQVCGCADSWTAEQAGRTLLAGGA